MAFVCEHMEYKKMNFKLCLQKLNVFNLKTIYLYYLD